jgi:protein-S-isoprenylcysteine O-methyltransferase Ste14
MENRIPPPILTLALLVAMWFGAAAEPAPWWRTGLAVVLFMAAGVFGFPALRAFRRAGTTIDPVRIDRASALVTGGIYRVTRNPMYVALTLLLAAWATWLGGSWVWAGPGILVLWLDRFQIRSEERVMAARFGEDYRRYQAQVRPWL